LSLRFVKDLSLACIYGIVEAGGCLFNVFPSEVSLFASSMVLVAMGCVALVFSLLLERKSRALRRLSKNLSVGVFSKTFNVFDPSMERRRIISSHTGLVVFVAIYGAWLVVTVGVFTSFAAGGLLASVIFLVCAGLLMVDETQELNKNAGIFVEAIRSGTSLGVGDMRALFVMRRTLPKLSLYHLFLAAVFFASAFEVPYLSNVIFLVCADVAWVLFALSSLLIAVPLLSLIAVAGLFGAVIAMIAIGADQARKRLFGFPRSIRSDVLDTPFERMALYVRYMRHHPTLHEPLPEDTENISRKELEEHGGS
jgi:HAMP domain-containing protein